MVVWIQRHTTASVTVLSSGICFLGCYILTCLCEQFRLCTLGQHVSKILSKKGLFLLMTLALGGVSVFAMNCLNLSAISVPLPATEAFPAHDAPIEFKVGPLAVSVVTSMVFAFFGLYTASHDAMFAKNKKQIVDGFVEDAKEMTMKEVRNISAMKMCYIISTQSLGYLLLGGLLVGAGAEITACLAIWSVAVPDVKLVWNAGVLVGAMFFSWVFSTVSLWILFRLLSLYPRKEILRVVSAMFMAFCCITTHFISMNAIAERLDVGLAADDSTEVTGKHHIKQSLCFTVVLVIVVIFCFLLLILSVLDMRSWLHEASGVVHRHEALLNKLKGMHTDNFTMIGRYMRDSHLLGDSSHGESSNNGDKPSLLERSLTTVGCVLGRYLPLIRGGRVLPSNQCANALSSPSMLPPSSPQRPCDLESATETNNISNSQCNPPLSLRLPQATDGQKDIECGSRLN